MTSDSTEKLEVNVCLSSCRESRDINKVSERVVKYVSLASYYMGVNGEVKLWLGSKAIPYQENGVTSTRIGA